jgi:hypothetical protein
MFSLLGNAMPHATSGSLRLLAVAAETRSMVVPSIPTIAESGFPGFKAVPWNGLMAPAVGHVFASGRTRIPQTVHGSIISVFQVRTGEIACRSAPVTLVRLLFKGGKSKPKQKLVFCFGFPVLGFDRTRNGIMAGWRQVIELAMTDEEIGRLPVIARSRILPTSFV